MGSQTDLTVLNSFILCLFSSRLRMKFTGANKRWLVACRQAGLLYSFINTHSLGSANGNLAVNMPIRENTSFHGGKSAGRRGERLSSE